MAGRKYVSDYRLETHITPDGKAETVRVYQGPRFSYCATEAELRSLRLRILLWAVLVIVCLLPLLFNNTKISRTFYVILPMAFTLLPWFLLAQAAWRLGKFRQPLTREEKDQTDKRLRLSSLWLLILLGVTSAGCVVYCFLAGCQRGEWLCVAGVGAALAISVYLFTQRKKACTRQAETE